MPTSATQNIATYSNPSTYSQGENKVPFVITPSANFVPVTVSIVQDIEENVSEDDDDEALDPDLTRVFGERDRQFRLGALFFFFTLLTHSILIALTHANICVVASATSCCNFF
jgi:hypothetical protein